jgi:hypothetical protein
MTFVVDLAAYDAAVQLPSEGRLKRSGVHRPATDFEIHFRDDAGECLPLLAGDSQVGSSQVHSILVTTK